MGLYKVHEIFHSLQGEGRWTGTSSVFVRLSGCNLKCAFCDTDHETGRMMSHEEIVRAVRQYPARRVVLTGGEPSLQADAELTRALHEAGCTIAIETNGTHAVCEGIDWITLSPKTEDLALGHCDELKVVYQPDVEPMLDKWAARYPEALHYLQPCHVSDPEQCKAYTAQAVGYVMQHPEWTLSLQTHRYLGIE